MAANPTAANFPTLLALHYFSNGNRPEGVKILDKMKADLKTFPQAYFNSCYFYLRARET